MGSSVFLSLQVLLISSGVLSLALLLKVSVPLVMDFSVYRAPLLWSSLSSWLRPPYLYIIINCIIITIAASSRFQCRRHDDANNNNNNNHEEYHQHPKLQEQDGPDPTPAPIPISIPPPSSEILETDSSIYGRTVVPAVPEAEEEEVMEFEDKSPVVVNGSLEVKHGEDEEVEFVISESTWVQPKRTDSMEDIPEVALSPAEKPLISSRFAHRKPARPSPEGGRALRVSKPRRHETLENTWKAITEGRAMPLTRHLKKSDTWENHHHNGRGEVAVEPSPPAVKKSETFKDRTNFQHQLPPGGARGASPSPNKLRKEPSLSQDDLNRRVEAFIRKFNEEMRLQRQESLNQYTEMINRGAS